MTQHLMRHTSRTTAPVGAVGPKLPPWAGPTRLARPRSRPLRRSVRRGAITRPGALGD